MVNYHYTYSNLLLIVCNLGLREEYAKSPAPKKFQGNNLWELTDKSL